MTRSTMNRQRWLLLAGSMTSWPVLYGIVVALVARSQAPAAAETTGVRAVIYGVAALGLVASVIVTRVRVRGPVDAAALGGGADVPLPGPMAFQQASMIALALAESSAVFGLVHALSAHTGVLPYLPFGIASMLVMSLDTIPAGLGYWSAWEARQRADGAEVPIN